MTTEGNAPARKKRFYREGPPFYNDFEVVLSQLFGKHSPHHQAIVTIVMDLLKELNKHMGDCHAILGKTEQLIEEARARKEGPEEIEKLASICRDIQAVEIHLAESMKSCTNQMVDMIFPR